MERIDRSNGFHERPLTPNTLDSPQQLASYIDQPQAKMNLLLEEVIDVFTRQLDLDSLLGFSQKLQAQLRQHLQASEQCMLPSFNYNLPTGQEQGTYLALEVGGSNLRIAMVELVGRHQGLSSMRIIRIDTCPISLEVKQLVGHGFFDWMAERVKEILFQEGKNPEGEDSTMPLRMGVAWSFPIEQTSIRSGIVLGMGKGFYCSGKVKGHDLGDVIQQGFNRARLNVRLETIVNDSSSALLARAYLDPATRLAIILGTGINAAIHIPVASLAPRKFSARIFGSGEKPSHVLTNTEFSMFGKGIFPTTRWDEHLNASHIMPDYQPFEYLIAGVYISELVRLIIVEAASGAKLWGGNLPDSLTPPYTLDSKTLAIIDSDPSMLNQESKTFLQQAYPSPSSPTNLDLDFLIRTIRAVTKRSIAFFAAGVHALTSLMEELDIEAGLPSEQDHFSIGCDGSIINKYPKYMERAQGILDELRLHEKQDLLGTAKKRVILEKTKNSAVLGAGIAAALAKEYGGRKGESGPPSPHKSTSPLPV